MKVIALIRFGPEVQIDWGVLLAAAQRAGHRARLFIVGPPPAGAPYRPPSDPDPASSSGIYDAAIIWDDIDCPPDLWGLAEGLAYVHAWEVEPILGYRQEPQGDDERAVTLLGRLMFYEDLPDSAAKRSWKLHAQLAEQVHIGACHYVQNWVVRALVPDCPPTRGIPELRFPDARALVERFFDSDRGRAEILQDTAHFIASGPRLYLRKMPHTQELARQTRCVGAGQIRVGCEI